MTTFDMDWALPPRLGRFAGEGLHAKIQQGGFHVLLLGAGDKPVTYYQHERHGRQQLARIHVEFIAPREGSKTDRGGRSRAVIEVEPGLHAQTDPYVGLLLVENIEKDVSGIAPLGLKGTWRIRLPHPACFILQKILIRPRRRLQKRDNDAPHVFDVALLTRPIWTQMGATLARVESGGQFPKRWFRRVRQALGEVFASPDAPGPVGVARAYRSAMGESAAPTEDAVYRAMAVFLESVGLSNR
jgi:hypothetical protein